MFGDNKRDKVATLLKMEQQARELCNFNQTEMKATMSRWVRQDSRFNNVDPNRLVDFYQERRAAGAQIDLDDPELTGVPRPEYSRRDEY
jgi:hypothetical protein